MAKKRTKKKNTAINPIRIPIPDDLRARAKKIGFSDDQIRNYTDPEKLRQDCDQLAPMQTVDKPRVQQIKIVADKPKGEPASATLTTEITEYRAKAVRRASYDEDRLNSHIQRHKIKNIQKVTFFRNCVPVIEGRMEPVLITEILIDYLKG